MATESCESSDGFEQIILKLADCFLFKIPPLRSASGHRAESWDLEKPLFIGYLRIYQNHKKLCVRIYKFKNTYSKTPTDDNLTFFAECPVEIQPKESVTAYIDTVVDSTRYFVLKMKDRATGRTAQMGIGFLDRDPAFEFKNCLNEYIRYVSRMNVAAGGSTTDKDDTDGLEDGMHSFKMDNQDGSDDEDGENSATNQPSSLKQQNISSDLSIKPGVKIKIKSLGMHRTLHNTHNINETPTAAVIGSVSNNSSCSDDDGKNNNIKSAATASLILAPPPPPVLKSLSLLSPPPSVVTPTVSAISTDNVNVMVDSSIVGTDDDWGDFETAGAVAN